MRQAAEHRDFRESFQTFVARRVTPDYPAWREQGAIPRELLRTAAEDGFLGTPIPESFGGPGVEDPRFGLAIAEEAMLAQAPALALALTLANDVAIPAVIRDGSEAQHEALLHRLSDATITATVVHGDIAITGDGPAVTLEGSASFVAAGLGAELLVIAGHDGEGAPRAALANSGKDGTEVSSSPPGVGLQAAGLADIAFTGAPGQPLGEGSAPAERVLADLALALAGTAVAGARSALALAVDYVLDRRAFGQPIAQFQNTRQLLGEAAADIEAGSAFLDAAIDERLAGPLPPARAAALKLHCTELFGAVVDTAVQLHGGYGYMMEYPIAHAYADARFWRLYGGTSEMMRDAVAEPLLG